MKVAQQDMIINWNISKWRGKTILVQTTAERANFLLSDDVNDETKRRIQFLLRRNFQQGTAADRISNSYEGKIGIYAIS